jgi:hypothetical protein
MRLPLLLPLAALLAGCLKEGRPVVGRPLIMGRAVEKPEFVKDGTWVAYEVRQKIAEPPYSATYDWWMVNYDTAENRPLLQNVADRWGHTHNDAGTWFLVTDEVAVPSLSTTAGTLVLLDLDQGILDRISDVTSFSLRSDTKQFFYRSVSEGSKLAALHLRLQDGTDRLVGLSSGAAEYRGDRFYCVLGEDKTLSRLRKQDGPLEAIRSKVNRFSINADESWVLMQVTGESGKSQIVARQLDTGVEHVVPATQNAYWMDFSGTRFTYTESATDTHPATINHYDVVTEAHDTAPGPAGLVDIHDIQQRPNSTDTFYRDSSGQLAVVHKGEVDGHLITGGPFQLSWTEDGKYVLWIEPVTSTPPQGKLMIQDLDFQQPARQLSPKGSLVPVPGYFFIGKPDQRILVFWGQFGHNGVDLYYANHETGDNKVVAEGISEVVVTPFQIVGIVRVSEQDLTGDLVNKDLVMDKEVVLAHEVAAQVIYGDKVVFVLRERVSSGQDGLWAIGIDGTPPDAGVIEMM